MPILRLFLVCVVCLTMMTGPSGAVPPPEYVVDLDQGPSQRYNHILPLYIPYIQKIHAEIKRLVPNSIHLFLAMVFNTVTKMAFLEYAQEIEGIARVVGLWPTDVFILNSIYELRALCTSIVARDVAGKIMLARNLDFGYPEILRKLHVTLIYKKKGAEVYRCGGLVGFVGALTCMRPHAYAVSLNIRKLFSEIETLKAFLIGKPLVTWMIRSAIQQSSTYSQVVGLLSTQEAISGSYITVAGIYPNEGTVLTRGRKAAIDIQRLNESTWFISQCNNDSWAAKDERSVRAKEGMIAMGQHRVSLQRIADELLLRPPLLWNLSIATVLMLPSEGYMTVIPTESANV